MGLDLDELVSGKSYTQKEMSKRTGMIYTCVQELFNIQMDYPEKLVDGTIDGQELPNMSYINGMTYGKTCLLIVESDSDFTTVKGLVTSIAQGESLSNEETVVRDGLACWYISFDSSGVHRTMGNYSLIERSVEEIIDLRSGNNSVKFHHEQTGRFFGRNNGNRIGIEINFFKPKYLTVTKGSEAFYVVCYGGASFRDHSTMYLIFFAARPESN